MAPKYPHHVTMSVNQFSSYSKTVGLGVDVEDRGDSLWYVGQGIELKVYPSDFFNYSGHVLKTTKLIHHLCELMGKDAPKVMCRTATNK